MLINWYVIKYLDPDNDGYQPSKKIRTDRELDGSQVESLEDPCSRNKCRRGGTAHNIFDNQLHTYIFHSADKKNWVGSK